MTAATQTRGRAKDRDFGSFTDMHQELAAYVNKNSGLSPVTANQVKAVLALNTDFKSTPERKAALEAQKEKREAAKARFANMSEDQVKAIKKLERLESAAAKAKAEAQKLFNK